MQFGFYIHYINHSIPGNRILQAHCHKLALLLHIAIIFSDLKEYNRHQLVLRFPSYFDL